jgi:hypothetical protein
MQYSTPIWLEPALAGQPPMPAVTPSRRPPTGWNTADQMEQPGLFAGQQDKTAKDHRDGFGRRGKQTPPRIDLQPLTPIAPWPSVPVRRGPLTWPMPWPRRRAWLSLLAARNPRQAP